MILCSCPCINVLSIETSSRLNVETEPKTKWCGDGETEPMENLHLGNGISASAIMKKLKNCCHFVNMHHMEKIQVTELVKLGIWFSESMETEYQCQPLSKNRKKAALL